MTKVYERDVVCRGITGRYYTDDDIESAIAAMRIRLVAERAQKGGG